MFNKQTQILPIYILFGVLIEHAGNTNDVTHLVERITRASEIIHNRSIISENGLANTRETLLKRITDL